MFGRKIVSFIHSQNDWELTASSAQCFHIGAVRIWQRARPQIGSENVTDPGAPQPEGAHGNAQDYHSHSALEPATRFLFLRAH